MVKIVGIIGSLRPEAYSASALEQASDRLKALGAEVEIIDLRQMNLPFCNGGSDYPDYPDVEILRAKVKAADGLILATPDELRASIGQSNGINQRLGGSVQQQRTKRYENYCALGSRLGYSRTNCHRTSLASF